MTRTAPYRLAVAAALASVLATGAHANGAVTALEAYCGPVDSPTLVGMTPQQCGPWSNQRLFIRWSVTTDATPVEVEVDQTIMPAGQRCNVAASERPAAGITPRKCRVRARALPTSVDPIPPWSEWFPAGAPLERTIRVDLTAPPTTASPARPADFDGWYNKPITVNWTTTNPGAEASPVAACSTTTYSGPDTASVTLKGKCSDVAGNVSPEVATTIRYDATPPAVTAVGATNSGGNNLVTWQASADTQRVEVSRTTSLAGASDELLYSSTFGNQLIDLAVNPLAIYTYRVVAIDQAGNRDIKTISPVAVQPPSAPPPPGPVVLTTSLLRPLDNAVVRVPPVVRWPAVANANYYNVQLFIRGKKVLTAWPKSTRYNLPTKWTYRGKRYRMPKGVKVRWYVWPAFGTTAKPNFGPLIGTARFTVKKP